jgi:hypothetical protein
MNQIKHFINGEFVIGSASKFFDKRSPVNNTVMLKLQRQVKRMLMLP